MPFKKTHVFAVLYEKPARKNTGGFIINGALALHLSCARDTHVSFLISGRTGNGLNVPTLDQDAAFF